MSDSQKQQSNPINQHYVPQCLLELFSEEKNGEGKPMLWVINKKHVSLLNKKDKGKS